MEELSKARLKQFLSLERKKEREESGLFVAEGYKCIAELIKSGVQPLWLASRAQFASELSDLVSNCPRYLIPESMVSRTTLLKTSPGFCGVFYANPIIEVKDASVLPKQGLIVSDGIGDAGNLGTLIRTMHWFGLTQLWLAPGTTDPFNPKCVQSCMGSLGSIQLYKGSAIQLQDWLEETRVPCFVLTLGGNYSPMPDGPACLVLGNESHGVSRDFSKLGTPLTLPSIGNNPPDSLNVAVSFAVLMGTRV